MTYDKKEGKKKKSEDGIRGRRTKMERGRRGITKKGKLNMRRN